MLISFESAYLIEVGWCNAVLRIKAVHARGHEQSKRYGVDGEREVSPQLRNIARPEKKRRRRFDLCAMPVATKTLWVIFLRCRLSLDPPGRFVLTIRYFIPGSKLNCSTSLLAPTGLPSRTIPDRTYSAQRFFTFSYFSFFIFWVVW